MLPSRDFSKPFLAPRSDSPHKGQKSMEMSFKKSVEQINKVSQQPWTWSTRICFVPAGLKPHPLKPSQDRSKPYIRDSSMSFPRFNPRATAHERARRESQGRKEAGDIVRRTKRQIEEREVLLAAADRNHQEEAQFNARNRIASYHQGPKAAENDYLRNSPTRKVVPVEHGHKELIIRASHILTNTTEQQQSPHMEVNSRLGVKGFSVPSWQKDTISDWPRSAWPTRPRPTLFRQCFDRGEFPMQIDHNTDGKVIRWFVPPETLDYHHYLPLLFEALRETEHPYCFFARYGIRELLIKGCDKEKILPVVPQLIGPIREALNTRCIPILKVTLDAIQQLILSAPKVGEALVPYYRQILPVLNHFLNNNVNLLDETIGDIVVLTQETLELMERYGGEDAFINIKYTIPTYENLILTP